MTVYDRIKDLAEQRKLTISEVEDKLEMGKNSLYAWRKKTPNGTSLKKAADYFDTTTDYLLELTDNPYRRKPAAEDFDVFNFDEEDETKTIQRAAKNMSDEDRKKAIELWKVAFEKAFDDDTDN
jgi:transcriptional regulator with XRE-family HTH domain